MIKIIKIIMIRAYIFTNSLFVYDKYKILPKPSNVKEFISTSAVISTFKAHPNEVKKETII